MQRSLTIPGILVLLTLSAGCGNAGVWMQTWWGPLDVPEGESAFPAGGAYQVQGFVHRVSTDPAISGSAARDMLEVVLVGADQDVTCDAYTRFMLDVADMQVYMDDVLSLDPAARPPSWVSYVCQEIGGAARDAFGGEGVYRAIHTLIEVTGDSAPADGVFRAAVPGAEGGTFEGGELLTPGAYASRLYERSQHGEGILPDNDGAGTAPWQDPAQDIDPADLCPTLMGALLDDLDRGRETYPDRASMALQVANHRYYHHYKSQENISVKGEDRPLGVSLPQWSIAAEQGADVELTLFGQVSRAPDIFPYQQVLVSTQAATVALTPCAPLSGVAGLVWPEVPGLPGAPARAPQGDDDDSAGDDDDSAR
ncbi:MAG: hypothetical protein KDA24_04170 [Deltaproteobacteria bacterium]|nr:hypothetical protein [Deltaproteobacteria bacterium]